jgi:hypothetical protein
MEQISEGMGVVTVDHAILGAVSAVGEQDFEVRSNGHTWRLRLDAVFTVENDMVTLVCNRERLAEYQVREA